MNGAMDGPMTIEIWSDIVCPWCYIGKRRFERAVAQLTDEWGGSVERHFEIVYRPFQLDPTAPIGRSAPVTEVYQRKFGDQAAAIIDRVTQVAAADGLEFRLDLAKRANTLDAHRLMWWAGRPGAPASQSTLNEALMRAYFTEGLDIASRDVLVECAVAAGADGDSTAAFLDGDEGADEVQRLLATAQQAGITGVPAYVVAGSWTIPGAQDVDVFVQVLRRMRERSR